LAGDFTATPQLHDFFGRDENLSYLASKAERFGPAFQRFGDLLFKAGIGVDDEPFSTGIRLSWGWFRGWLGRLLRGGFWLGLLGRLLWLGLSGQRLFSRLVVPSELF